VFGRAATSVGRDTCRTTPIARVHVERPIDPRREPHDVQVSAGRAQELALRFVQYRRQTARHTPGGAAAKNQRRSRLIVADADRSSKI